MVWAVARAATFVVSSRSSSSPSSGYRFRRIKFVRDCERWGCNCSESHSQLQMPTKKSSATTTTTPSGNSELSRYGLDQWDFDLSASSSSGTSDKIAEEEEAEAASKRWVAYLISSADSARTYVGITTNMKRRLKQHNGELAGGAKSGRAGRPWSLLCTVGSFSSRSEASQFEYQWKSRTKSVHGIKRTQADDEAKDRLIQRRRVALEQAIDADPKWKALIVEWRLC